jgi:hypothetical protein
LMISMTKAGFAVVHHLSTRMSHVDFSFKNGMHGWALHPFSRPELPLSLLFSFSPSSNHSRRH